MAVAGTLCEGQRGDSPFSWGDAFSAACQPEACRTSEKMRSDPSLNEALNQSLAALPSLHFANKVGTVGIIQAAHVIAVQEFSPSPEGEGKSITIGEYVRDIFLEQVRYCKAISIHTYTAR